MVDKSLSNGLSVGASGGFLLSRFLSVDLLQNVSELGSSFFDSGGLLLVILLSKSLEVVGGGDLLMGGEEVSS